MLKLTRWTVFAGLLIAAALPVYAQILPTNDAHAARVVSLSGTVNVLRDNQEWALSTGDSIHMRQEVVSGPDGHAIFQVSDGSTFEVFPNSHVIFRKNPGNWRDLIDVFVGKIKVHIQHLDNKPNPNKVYTPSAVISVRGTTFEVTVDEEESTVIAVEEGLVDVRHALLPSDRPKLVQGGESVTVYRNYPLEARGYEKSTVISHVLRAIVDALQTMASGTPRTGGGVGGVGGSAGGSSGDTKRPDPPPPPPPPPGPPH